MQPQTVSVMKNCDVAMAEGTGDVIAEIIGDSGYNAKTVFYLSNHRGDTLATYRGDATLVAKYRYDACGNVVEKTGRFAPRYTFSTKEYLPDAQVYLYAYRVYDPVAGRWTQRAPIDYHDSLNLYQFCGNNPLVKIDSNGMRAEASALTVVWSAAIAEPTPFGEVIALGITVGVLDYADSDKMNQAIPQATAWLLGTWISYTVSRDVERNVNSFLHVAQTHLDGLTSPEGKDPGKRSDWYKMARKALRNATKELK